MSDISEVEGGPVEQSGWARLGHLVVQLSLVGGAVVVFADSDLASTRKLVALGLAAALLVWHWLMAYQWRYWDLQLAPFVGVMVVAAGLWITLMLLHAGFGVSVIGAYIVAACPFLTRAVVSISVLSAALLAVAAADGGLSFGEFAGVTLTGLAVIVLHGVLGRIHAQNAQQRELIAELQATRAELASREREAGVLAERERLARDIHDSLAQGFTSIIMQLEAADAQLAVDAVDVRARIDQARQAARDHLAEVRRVVWSLRPGPLERGALVGALDVLVTTSFVGGDVDAEFVVDGDPSPMPPDHEVVIYRAAQEACANVVKHAGASRVVCTLTFLDDETILDVNDDGRGFDAGRTATGSGGGLGLVGLRERLASVAGSLHIESSPGGGTNLAVAIPTSRDQAMPARSESQATS